jgi:hypothetical protein
MPLERVVEGRTIAGHHVVIQAQRVRPEENVGAELPSKTVKQLFQRVPGIVGRGVGPKVCDQLVSRDTEIARAG